MSFVITTVIDGIPHGVKPDGKKFNLIPINKSSDVYRIMNLPQLSLARSILSWIENNDPKFSEHQFEISPAAKFG
mgnify:CR=1 FL=1